MADVEETLGIVLDGFVLVLCVWGGWEGVGVTYEVGGQAIHPERTEEINEFGTWGNAICPSAQCKDPLGRKSRDIHNLLVSLRRDNNIFRPS